MGHSVIDSNLHTGSWNTFKTILLSDFSVAFLGIGLMRFWYQFNLYNLHFSVDYGHVTVGANLVRVALLALIVFLLYRGYSIKRPVFVWTALICMTLSGAFFLVDLFFETAVLEVPRFILGGVGMVGGGIVWILFLQRLKPGEAFFHVSAGLAFSCLLSIVFGYLSPSVAGILNLFVPATFIILFWFAMSKLDGRNAPEEETSNILYREEHQPYVFQLILAFTLYALLLGLALGYPDGRLRELSQVVRVIHQSMVIVCVVFVVWWVLIRGHGFRVSVYWSFINILMILSIGFLMSKLSGTEEASSFFSANAITFFYLPLVFFIYLIARHSQRSAVFYYGVIYGAALLAMGIGRIITYVIGPHLGDGPWLLLGMTFVALIEIVLVLRPHSELKFPLCFELKALAPERPKYENTDPEFSEKLEPFIKDLHFTSTEAEITRLVSQGRTRKVIAQQLNYSDNTIRNYMRVIYQKVGVGSKQELLDAIEQHENE